jgi:hypothetical protein
LFGTTGRADELTPERILAPLKVATLDELPVVGEASPGGRILLRLSAYAASPGMIDERRIGGGMPYAEELALAVLPAGSGERVQGGQRSAAGGDQATLLRALWPGHGSRGAEAAFPRRSRRPRLSRLL